jgi:predicted Fe-Mo cluster-binding NifX family protein
MRIAVPVVQGELSPHFGHCEAFALLDADVDAGSILEQKTVPAPDHQPGLLPRWLAEQGADMIIAGGMGSRAQGLFAQQGISVVVGAPRETPAAIVKQFMAGTLQTGDNVCDH